MPDDLRERLKEFSGSLIVGLTVRDALARIDELEAALAAMTAEAEEFARCVAATRCNGEDGGDPYLWHSGGQAWIARAMRWLAERKLFVIEADDGDSTVRGRFIKRETADA